jgi:hypothetical protein
MVVDVDDQDFHRVSDSAHGVHAGNVTIGQFADVAQSIFARKDFHKGAEVADAGDDTIIDLTDLDGGCAGLNAG